MVLKFAFRAFVFLFGFISVSYCPAIALEPKMHTMTIGPEAGYYKFKQTGMKEDGFLYGLGGAYTYRGKLGLDSLPSGMAKIEGRLIFGRVNFDGTLYDGNHYEIKSVKDLLGEIRGVVGYDFEIFSSTTIVPFAGLGYRYLKDQLQKSDAGYRRVSNYLYTPLGFETNMPLNNGWSAGLSAEYDFFWCGWQETYLSDLDSPFSDLTNDQDGGYGIKASIKIRKAMEDKNYIFEPYLDYWNVDSSDVRKVYHTGVYANRDFQEPAQKALLMGMKVAVEF